MLLRFFATLQETGRAELVPAGRDLAGVLRDAGSTAEERQELHRLLEGWHHRALLDLAGAPLPYHPAAAWWGALTLFRAACYASFREIEPEEIHRGISGESLPDAHLPEAHFSADLSLRHWADLFRMARALSEDDPLVARMKSIALQAPLAGPGVTVELPQNSPVFDHPGLCQLLAERVFSRKDHELLGHPRLASWIRHQLGHHAPVLGLGLLPALEVES